MRDPSRCPMCGEAIDSEDAAIICGTCRMGIPSGTPYYVVAGGGRRSTFCSAGCVRTHVLMTTSA